jgi:hypothetical protein
MDLFMDITPDLLETETTSADLKDLMDSANTACQNTKFRSPEEKAEIKRLMENANRAWKLAEEALVKLRAIETNQFN